jgi:uncharacterized membrane protein
MAKQKSKQQANILDPKTGHGMQLIRSDEHDDTPLPSADELAKYKALHPEVVPWLMKISEKEQDHRHSFENSRIKLVNDVNSKLYTIDIIRIVCAFIIVISGFLLSGILLYNDKLLIGSLFAGTTMLGAVAMFLKSKREETEVKP